MEVKTVKACFGRDLRGGSALSSCGRTCRNLFVNQAKRIYIGASTIGHYFNFRFAPATIQQRLSGGPTHTVITVHYCHDVSYVPTSHMYQRLDGL
jgi:hypothetical protein